MDTYNMYIMWILQNKVIFFGHRLKYQLHSWLLRLGCYLFTSWYYLDNDSILTTGKVLKLDRIYTYREGNDVNIVRPTNVQIESNYLYCTLFFFSKNTIITVRQTLLKDATVLWSLSDNREFDEIMSIRLWNEVNKEEELLEFDF